MRKIIIKFLIAAALIIPISACMGGGSFGTGINGYGTQDSQGLSLKYAVLGTLTDLNNKPVSGVIVTVDAGAMHEQATSDKNGKFKIDMKTSSGAPVTFKVNRGGKTAGCTTYVSPAGEDYVTLSFKLSSSNLLVCP